MNTIWLKRKGYGIHAKWPLNVPNFMTTNRTDKNCPRHTRAPEKTVEEEKSANYFKLKRETNYYFVQGGWNCVIRNKGRKTFNGCS